MAHLECLDIGAPSDADVFIDPATNRVHLTFRPSERSTFRVDLLDDQAQKLAWAILRGVEFARAHKETEAA